MHFDDRLATVLRMRADGGGLRRIQFRQLLDEMPKASEKPRTVQGSWIVALVLRGAISFTIGRFERRNEPRDSGVSSSSPDRPPRRQCRVENRGRAGDNRRVRG